MSQENESTEKLKIIAEHYNKTFESASEFWKERNALFFWLLGVSAGVILLGSHVIDATIVTLMLKYASPDKAAIPSNEIQLIFRIIESTLAVAMLVLMTIIYQRTRALDRYYLYIGQLEPFIRKELKIADEHIFEREGEFYKNHVGSLQRSTWLTWVGILTLIFLGVVIARIKNTKPFAGSFANIDWTETILSVTDISALSLFALYGCGYAASSFLRNEPKDNIDTSETLAKNLYLKWQEAFHAAEATQPNTLEAIGNETAMNAATSYVDLPNEIKQYYRKLATETLKSRRKSIFK